MEVGVKRELEEKVRSGERLTREDGHALHAADDLAWLGGLAHGVRTRVNGTAGHFVAGRHIDTPVEDAVALAGDLADEGLTELRLTAGVRDGLPWEAYPRAMRALRDALPGVSLQIFTAGDILTLETLAGRDASAVLDELIDAGLGALTTGSTGATETGFAESGDDWPGLSRVHRLAHAKGLLTPAVVGHGPDGVDHLLQLRALQDETGGFQVLVPLPRPQGPAVTPLEALKTFAVARLLLDNVPHLRALWTAYGLQTAQLALQHGADDLDGSLTEADLTRDDLVALIRDAGFRPVRRDARYGTVQEHEGPDPARREAPQPMRI
ncbi:aminofutalosine synthase MqnE [Streptomyces sp. NPDC093252]|uniref:aminofutalosine synthase MqnE n=1 Tax=Streptomyces sp. NPDC093252 TaxID=3154980 RepID=UPI00343A1A89